MTDAQQGSVEPVQRLAARLVSPPPGRDGGADAGSPGAFARGGVEGGCLPLADEILLHEEAGAVLLHGPFWSTSRLAPFLPVTERREVMEGRASWTLAEVALVPDLDTAARIAVVGGDTVWELEGCDREVLSSVDETRPLGVISGGEVTRPLFPSTALGAIRARSLLMLAGEAIGVARRCVELDGLGQDWLTEIADARHAARQAAEAVDAHQSGAAQQARQVRATAVRLAVTVTEATAVGDERATWESPFQRLRRRALWLALWDAPGERLLSGGRTPEKD